MDIANKLSAAVAIPTVSFSDRTRIEYGRFEEFLEFLPSLFPRVFERAEFRKVGGYSMILRLPGKAGKGKNGSGKAGLGGGRAMKEPVLFLAHYDVVPAEETEKWKYPPFDGTIAEGFVWGRGAIDNKGTLIMVLQALEELLEKGWEAERDIYVVSGHDEEIGGTEGARKVEALLREEGIRLHAVYDEGMTIITPELFPIVNRDVAFVGTSEKGHVDIEISARGQGGHASMPPGSTAAGMIGRAVAAIEKKPFRPRIIGPVAELLRNIAPHTRGFAKLALRNPTLWGPVLKRSLQSSTTSNALVRTTQAVTMLQGSPKENVLPDKSSAVINCRILPGETIEDVLNHFRRTTEGIGVEVGLFQGPNGCDPLPVSSTSSEGYQLLSRAIGTVFPEVVVSPSIVLAATDSRYFYGVSDNIYRFVPVVLNRELFDTIHGTDERISIEGLKKACRVYGELFQQL